MCECEYVCVTGRVWLGRQVSWTTNIVCRPVKNQGFFTRLVNTLTKTEPNHDPIPKPRTPQTQHLQTPEWIRAWLLTSKADTKHTHASSCSVMHNNHCNMPQQDTVCVTPHWFLSPPMFVCQQLTIMRTVGLDRKPCILCYYGSAIITQEVCLSWLQPPLEAAERRQNHL